ncbi:MAG: tail fiber domain-containing protein [Pseudomonadota bacterium]|nr:tail fiber domain-containing protein [Pseudomonadota bacterium]
MRIVSSFMQRQRGFTMVELIIGLAVLGVLFAGVWRLIGGMNQQLQDQAVARQTKAIAEAANRYSQVERPRIVLLAPNQWHIIGVVNDPATPMPELQPAFLSPNVSDTNPLGQRYQVLVRHDGTNVETFVASTGATIPVDDLRAARIVGMIGADAGTLYSDEPPGAPVIRGAYGGWTRPVSDFAGVIPMAAGDIITGTMFATTDLGSPFLYRDVVAGHPEFNRMNTNIDMNRNSLNNVTSVIGQDQLFIMAEPQVFIRRADMSSPVMLDVRGRLGVSHDAGFNGNLNVGCGTDVFNCGAAQARIEPDGDIVTEGGVSARGQSFFEELRVTDECGVNNFCLRVMGAARFSGAVNIEGAPLTVNGQTFLNGSTEINVRPGVGVGTLTVNTPAVFNNQVDFYQEAEFYVRARGRREDGNWYKIDLEDGPSDIRLKENIRPIDDALEKLLKIRGVYYDWKNPLSGWKADPKSPADIGVIAQEVEAVFPELVKETETGMKMVNYEHLIGAAIEALRELKAENDALRKRVEQLEKKIYERE